MVYSVVLENGVVGDLEVDLTTPQGKDLYKKIMLKDIYNTKIEVSVLKYNELGEPYSETGILKELVVDSTYTPMPVVDTFGDE